jgi:hypothetical protein
MYLYDTNRNAGTQCFGRSEIIDTNFVKNRWYTVRLYIRRNTAGKNDGKMYIWVNDVLKTKADNLKWSNNQIDADFLDFNYFRGGSGDPPEIDTFLEIDYIKWWQNNPLSPAAAASSTPKPTPTLKPLPTLTPTRKPTPLPSPTPTLILPTPSFYCLGSCNFSNAPAVKPSPSPTQKPTSALLPVQTPLSTSTPSPAAGPEQNQDFISSLLLLFLTLFQPLLLLLGLQV